MIFYFCRFNKVFLSSLYEPLLPCVSSIKSNLLWGSTNNPRTSNYIISRISNCTTCIGLNTIKPFSFHQSHTYLQRFIERKLYSQLCPRTTFNHRENMSSWIVYDQQNCVSSTSWALASSAAPSVKEQRLDEGAQPPVASCQNTRWHSDEDDVGKASDN